MPYKMDQKEQFMNEMLQKIPFSRLFKAAPHKLRIVKRAKK